MVSCIFPFKQSREGVFSFEDGVFCGRFWIFFGVPGSMLSCFFASLPFCFSAFPAFLPFCFSASLLFLLLRFPAFLLFAFPAFPAFLLLCFSALCFPCFFAFLFLCLPCFSAFVPFYFYYSTYIFFFQSCVLAAILPAQLLLCLLSSLSLCFSFYFALFSPVCILNETLKRP